MTSGDSHDIIAFVVHNADFLAGFVLPFTLATIGLIGPVFFFEWAVRHPYFQQYHITYKQGQPRYTTSDSRNLNKAGTRDQLSTALLRRIPCVAVLSLLLYSLKLNMLSVQALTELPQLSTMMIQYVCYYYFSDLLAWIVHYAEHKNDFLWRHVHSKHHQEHTPTALTVAHSTIYEAILNGGLPNIVAAAVIQPHCLVFFAGLFTNLCGVAYAHSGIQHRAFDCFLSVGFVLPFCASSRLHDKHHRRAGRKLQDLGEHLWLWDYLAGTLSPGPV